MGWVMMSERELNRVNVLAQINDGRLTVANRMICEGVELRICQETIYP